MRMGSHLILEIEDFHPRQQQNKHIKFENMGSGRKFHAFIGKLLEHCFKWEWEA